MLFLRDLISFIFYIFAFFRKYHNKRVVLLYHSVGYIEAEKDIYRINISPERFGRHLKVISRYKGRIEITFDDGYRNNFEYAFALLREYNLKATIFLVTDFIDGKIMSRDIAGKDFDQRPLTWEEIKIMDDYGIRFGSHSKTHISLVNLGEDNLKKEIFDSKKRIEDILQHRIDRFAYPYGNFNAKVKDMIRQAGYKNAYTNIMADNMDEIGDSFGLKRIRLYREDGPFRLKMKISGAYDWVDKIRKV